LPRRIQLSDQSQRCVDVKRRRQKFRNSWQNRNRGTWSQGFFEKKIVFISFSAGCSSEFLGKINLFIFYNPKQKEIVVNDLE